MEQLGLRVDLGLPGAGPFHIDHIDAMLVTSARTTSPFGPAVRSGRRVGHRTLWPFRPSMAWNSGLGFPRHQPHPHVRRKLDQEKLLSTMEGAVGYAVEQDIPVMFVTEDTTRSSQKTSFRSTSAP